MKIILAALALFVTAGTIYVYNLLQQSQLQQQLLADYAQNRQLLLTQVEENSLKRLEYVKEIQQLRSDLNISNRQLISLSRQLAENKDLIDPDYQKLENKIRNEVAEEYRQQQQASTDTSLQLSLIRQLSALNPAELGVLMSVNAQYGEFLNSLNVSDGRMEVIIAALNNMTKQQSQAMQELMTEINFQDLNRGDFRAQMMTINSPETIREILSYELTENELEVFADFQQNQAAILQDRLQATNGVFNFSNGIGTFVGGPLGIRGLGGAIQISPVDPR